MNARDTHLTSMWYQHCVHVILIPLTCDAYMIPTWSTCDAYTLTCVVSKFVVNECTGDPFDLHVISTLCTCNIHTPYMWCLYLHGVHVILIPLTCDAHVIPNMVYMWYSYPLHVIPTWCTYILIPFTCDAHVAHYLHLRLLFCLGVSENVRF